MEKNHFSSLKHNFDDRALRRLKLTLWFKLFLLMLVVVIIMTISTNVTIISFSSRLSAVANNSPYIKTPIEQEIISNSRVENVLATEKSVFKKTQSTIKLLQHVDSNNLESVDNSQHTQAIKDIVAQKDNAVQRNGNDSKPDEKKNVNINRESKSTVKPHTELSDGAKFLDAVNARNNKLYSTGCEFSKEVAEFRPEELDIHCGNIDEVIVKKKIGSGYYREVRLAEWKGKRIVVKTMIESRKDEPNSFRNMKEAVTMFATRGEKNLVQLLGWCNDTIITEWLPQNLVDISVYPKLHNITVLRAMEMARDAARGLANLHSHGIAHRDILSRQFLLNEQGEVFLNDFNMVEFAGPRENYTKTIDWLSSNTTCKYKIDADRYSRCRAPEEYADDVLDEKVDIYSLALVFWELRSRVYPFMDRKDGETMKAVLSGERPPIDAMSDYPQAMQNLITEAWAQDPIDRPSADQIANRIDIILDQYRRKHHLIE